MDGCVRCALRVRSVLHWQWRLQVFNGKKLHPRVPQSSLAPYTATRRSARLGTTEARRRHGHWLNLARSKSAMFELLQLGSNGYQTRAALVGPAGARLVPSVVASLDGAGWWPTSRKYSRRSLSTVPTPPSFSPWLRQSCTRVPSSHVTRLPPVACPPPWST